MQTLADTLLRFDYTPEEIKNLSAAAKAEMERKIGEIIAVPDSQRTFENTILAHEHASGELGDAVSIPICLGYVSTDAEVRKAANQLELEISQYFVEIVMRRDLYRAIKAYADAAPALPEKDKRLLDKVVLEFERNGLKLPEKKLARLKELNKKLIDLSLKFSVNLREAKDRIEVTREELAGLPEDYINKLGKTPDGKYIITMDYPDYTPFMENAASEYRRKELEFKFNNRCAQENTALMEETFALRRRAAKLLGYKSHAHYVLEERMAQTPQAVTEFLKRLHKKLKPKGRKELRRLINFKRKDTANPAVREMRAWEWRYYNNRIKKEKIKLDHEVIKEYFPLEKVFSGLISVFETVFSVKFVPSSARKWHDDVAAYELRDAADGRVIGNFYLDLFPRDGKYKHAACFGLTTARKLRDGSYLRPAAAIVANFNKPSASAPSLLTHREIQTLFHEFGHVTHQMFTTAEYGRFSGTSVSRDFVETPSKMLEYWVWYPQVLKLLSGHYKTGEQLPDELINKLIEDKNSDTGLAYLRQVFFSLLDIKYHTAAKADTTKIYESMMGKISLVPMTPGTHPQASFNHLMNGYDAAYYGYLWSESLAADLFSRFAENGIMDAATGKRYRELILAPGRSFDEMEQVRKFLGREPQEDAFVKSLGLNY